MGFIVTVGFYYSVKMAQLFELSAWEFKYTQLILDATFCLPPQVILVTWCADSGLNLYVPVLREVLGCIRSLWAGV